MFLRALFYVVAVSLAATACTGASAAFSPPPDETYPPQQVDEGQLVYQRSCSVCHGSAGTGRVGPNIVMVWERLTLDEQREVVVGGRRGMPSFEITLDPDQIEAVLAFTRTGWAVAP